jgi:hypothetical protein
MSGVVDFIGNCFVAQLRRVTKQFLTSKTFGLAIGGMGETRLCGAHTVSFLDGTP